MAAKGMPYLKTQRNMQRFTTILTSTACEWFLIFLLLIEAVYSFLLTKFAVYCKLQLPCILCSRLDHLLGNERPEFYRNLLCSNHKSEISSLICCCKHGKLANGCSMCDDCLLSFLSNNYSNADMHMLLFGKLGFDLVGCGSPRSNPNKDFKSLCSCCNKPWKSGQNLQRLLQFIELKIASNSESEFLFHNHDAFTSVIRDINEAKDDADKPHDIKCLTPNVFGSHNLTELNWQHCHQKTYSNPLPELISPDEISHPYNTSEVPTGKSPICQSINHAAIADPVSLLNMNPSSEAEDVPVEVLPKKGKLFLSALYLYVCVMTGPFS